MTAAYRLHRSLRTRLFAGAIFAGLLLSSLPALAEVGDPTLATDHPHYPGEGVFQNVQGCVDFATAGAKTPQDKAIALYMWLLTHQFHLMSPQEWNAPGYTPDTEQSRQQAVVYDAARSRFSYGYGLCGTVHAWNEPYWKAAGFPARRRAFPGHVNSEIYYDKSWHAFDTDMAGLLFRRDGQVAGYDDIIKDPTLVDSVKPPIPHYPFAWPSDFNGMKQGWRTVAEKKKWYALYNSGYEGQPGIVHLRIGERFTRLFDPDYFGGPGKRRFWHHMKNGPQRNWTFVNNGDPRHQGDQANARGNASYCNGLFDYTPNLGSPSYREGLVWQSANVIFGDASPRLHSFNGDKATVEFRHFSPYVICGDPVDDANPMTGTATDGLVVSGKFVGDVSVSVSADEGQTWTEAAGPLPLDLTEQVKGRYGWRIRFSWSGTAGIDALRFVTTTQVNQTIYPRLTAEGSDVTYRCARRGVVAVTPNFRLEESEAKQFEDVTRRSDNLRYRPRSAQQRLAYQTTNNKPAQIVFPVEAPGELLAVRAAANYQLRVPPPPEHDYKLEISTDDGQSWRPFAQAEIPTDNEYSSGWLADTVDISDQAVKRALVRVTLYAGGHTTGLIDFEAYGLYQTPTPGPIRATFGWSANGRHTLHPITIPAGAEEHKWQVPTGKNIRDEMVVLEALERTRRR